MRRCYRRPLPNGRTERPRQWRWGESCAYEIASTLAQGVGMGEGTIYPLMRRMQDDGLVDTRLVESSSGPPRKYYRLTASGRAAFAEQKREWRSFADAVNQLLGETR